MGAVSSPAPALPTWALMTSARVAHVQRVAALVEAWAEVQGVAPGERARWLRAVWLHDALRDAPEGLLRELAPDPGLPSGLHHGPAAASRAQAEGETDAGVLDAVRYHSIGWDRWDAAGRVLYCADYLDPGRPFDPEARADLARRFPAAPDDVLLAVARRRLMHLVRSGWPLLEPTQRFWNGLVAAAC